MTNTPNNNINIMDHIDNGGTFFADIIDADGNATDGNPFRAPSYDDWDIYCPGAGFIAELAETLGDDCLGCDVQHVETGDDSIVYTVNGHTLPAIDWKHITARDIDAINNALRPLSVIVYAAQ